MHRLKQTMSPTASWRALLFLLLVPLFLSGCWDRKEINDVAFVVGDALDKTKDGYRLSFQIPLPSQLGGAGTSGGGGGTTGGKSWYIDSVVGQSGRGMVAAAQKSLSRTLYFAHRRVILFGEEMARSGLEAAVDSYSRVPQNRMTAFVCITQGPARDILNAGIPTEPFPSEVIRELAQSSMKQPRTLKHFAEDLLTDGVDPIVPSLALTDSEPGPQGKSTTQIKMSGLAVFRESHLVGFLDDKQASGVLWAMNQAKNPTLVVDAPQAKGDLSFHFPENNATLRVERQGPNIIMHINVHARGAMIENHSDYDISSADNLNIMEKQVAAQIKSNIESSIKTLQTKYGADPLGFGNAIYRKYPAQWKQIRKDWNKIFPKLQVVVETDIHLEHTGTLTKPLGIKEGDLVK